MSSPAPERRDKDDDEASQGQTESNAESTSTAGAVKVAKFPYPPLLQFSLMAVVVFAAIHSFFTREQVDELARQGRATTDTWLAINAMLLMTIALALFVSGVLFYRARLALHIADEGVTIRQLHWRSARRNQTIFWADITRAKATSDARGVWYLWLEWGRERKRFPLSHAIVGDERHSRPSSKEEAEKHPLIVALRQHLGERVVID